MIPIHEFHGHKVAVFGLGMSGLASARALRAGSAEVTAWDDNASGVAKARIEGLNTEDLRAADWSAFSALILAPGVPLTHPEPHWTVAKARAAGVEVIGDTELFCRERRRVGSVAKIAAITGTNGKSTTAALTAHILKQAGRRVALGGNIGVAALDLPPFSDDMHYVLEYSSYQIDLTPTLDATAAALLNVTPDHLDRHGTLAQYAAVKARIFARLGAEATAVIGVDDPISAAIAEGLNIPAIIRRISCARHVESGVFARGAQLFETRGGVGQEPVSIKDVGSLRGVHNWQNAAAAFALCRGLGLSRKEIAEGLRSFPGLAHRMQEVGRVGRVLFVNDSKATNVDATSKALASFDDIYWIAGGRAKEGGLAGLEPFFPKIAKAYLIGEAEAEFAHALDDAVDTVRCGGLEAAVARAALDAEDAGGANAVVLLSPACASFDHYPNFMARGDHFRSLVARLPGAEMREAFTA
ncbi:MAG: UDP-N-acetylmuramoyl-L-alanine--D-glutamate ligase [Hyphomicrobiales bacterium]|nr:UDP-N-acetylmuramoyl-L-alanine--D-glutamate ligase [Hyphomicrobiales bacterium]